MSLQFRVIAILEGSCQKYKAGTVRIEGDGVVQDPGIRKDPFPNQGIRNDGLRS